MEEIVECTSDAVHFEMDGQYPLPVKGRRQLIRSLGSGQLRNSREARDSFRFCRDCFDLLGLCYLSAFMPPLPFVSLGTVEVEENKMGPAQTALLTSGGWAVNIENKKTFVIK